MLFEIGGAHAAATPFQIARYEVSLRSSPASLACPFSVDTSPFRQVFRLHRAGKSGLWQRFAHHWGKEWSLIFQPVRALG